MVEALGCQPRDGEIVPPTERHFVRLVERDRPSAFPLKEVTVSSILTYETTALSSKGRMNPLQGFDAVSRSASATKSFASIAQSGQSIRLLSVWSKVQILLGAPVLI